MSNINTKWGSLITRRLAQTYPTNCVAIHLNFVHVSKLTKDGLTGEELRGAEKNEAFQEKGRAYAAMQGTTPYVRFRIFVRL